MVDLKNKRLIKIMWLPDEEEILFDGKNETPISIKSELYKYVFNFVDLDDWKNLFKIAYDKWLNNDDDLIYNINAEISQMMIRALIQTNKNLANEVIFYWFDIDRTNNENFKWEYCPISKKKLIVLGEKFPEINSFISPDYPLIFPR